MKFDTILRTYCLRGIMRVTFPWALLAPFSLVGFFVLTSVAGAQIPEGMLIEDGMVAPPHPAESPRHHKASSADRDESNSLNSMNDNEAEDQVVQEEETSTCVMEIQVTRRIPGRCVSLGRTRGCVAGIYLHPLHHECL